MARTQARSPREAARYPKVGGTLTFCRAVPQPDAEKMLALLVVLNIVFFHVVKPRTASQDAFGLI